MSAPKHLHGCTLGRNHKGVCRFAKSFDPASIPVFLDGHRPRVVGEPDPALVRAVNPVCGAVLAWEQLQGLLVTRGKSDRRGRTVYYYHARCPACGAEARQQRAPMPGQTCEQPKS
jgi:hypothetical protein